MIHAEMKRVDAFDPKVHVTNTDAATIAGYSPKYFSTALSRAYKLTRYTDWQSLFYDQDELNTVMAKMKSRQNEHGKHRRGQRPKRTSPGYVIGPAATKAKQSKREVQNGSEFPKVTESPKKRWARIRPRTENGKFVPKTNGTIPEAVSHVAITEQPVKGPQVTIVATIDMIKELIKSGIGVEITIK